MKAKSILLLLFIIVPLSGLFGEGKQNSEAARELILQLKWYYQFQFAGYIAAVEQGYYEDEGLAVEIRQGGPEISPAEEVEEGRAHFGIENSEVLLYRLRGSPLVALAAVVQHSPLVLLSRADSRYITPHSLIGEKVMMGEGLTDIEIAAMFQQEGVRIESIEKLGYTLDPEVFLSPEIAAIAAYSTNTPYLLREAGVSYRTINPISYGIDFYSDVLFTGERLMEREPETVLAFRRASMRGWEYAMDNPAEMAELLKRKYESGKSLGHLLYEAEAMRELMLPDLVEIGHMSEARWRRIAETFGNLGMIDEVSGFEGFLYDDYLEIDPVRWRRIGLVSLIVFAGLLMSAFFLIIYNYNLRKAVSVRTKELSETNIALKEKERDLTRAQTISHIGNWVFDPETRRMRVSEELRQILGMRFEDPELSQFMDVIDPAYRTLVESLFDDIARTGEKTEVDFRIFTPDGEDKIVKSIAEGIKDENGGIVQLYGTVQDITEKKIADDQLHIQRDLALGVGGAATLSDAAALSIFGVLELANTDCAGLFMVDEKKKEVRLLYSEGFSDKFTESMRILPADTYFWRELQKTSPLEIGPDQPDLAALNKMTGEKLRYAVFFPLEYRGQSFGAIGVGSHIRKKLHKFEIKALSDLAAQISNVIWQKKIEDALRFSENRYRGLYQSLMYGISQTNPEGYFIESNKAFREMLGYGEEELRRKRFMEITPEKWHDFETTVVGGQLKERGYSDEFEKEYYRKDGTIVPVAMRVWVNEMGPEGAAEYWSVVQDISERKQSEQIIIKTMKELERSNEELKQFAYVASHDLQEPLRAMTGFSELLKDRYTDNLDEGAGEFLDFIIDGAGRMQQLINDLLSYSRLNTVVRPFERCNLTDAVETAKLNLTAQIQDTRASVSVSGLPTLYCDRLQMIQLFQNLIGNGLKYQPEGNIPEISIYAREEGNAWIFSVEDNGMGINPKFREVIFQMFQRLHTKDEFQGTGIGLAMCRKIVERHGGAIWVEDKNGTDGSGSVFRFTIMKGLEEAAGENS